MACAKTAASFPWRLIDPLETNKGQWSWHNCRHHERKRAEEALRESEDQFRTMATLSALAWMAHADGFIFWYNQRWHDYTGKTPEQWRPGLAERA